ncbi:hypothetical protein HOI26_02105 [Candidatus Woesearchaeota archaeon]|nr:hypothetical protein [Candidatus Woesearchaeota archaeon]MBT5739870.1 hypothetical protein [Candidatus Woesearchaeota archaeon]
MAERTLIVDHLKLRYEGLFNTAELYNMIGAYFFENGYNWSEPYNQEKATSEGRQIEMVLEPNKSVSDFYKFVVRIKINGTDIRAVEVEHEDKAVQLDHGVLHLTFDGYLVADRKGKWKDKPWKYFLGLALSKYFYKNKDDKFSKLLEQNIAEIHQLIKNYLNMVNYTYSPHHDGPEL